MTVTALALDRAALLDRFTRIRARSRALFDLLDERMYYERPIALRNPVVFYDGHLPAFAVNALIKKALYASAGNSLDAQLDLERDLQREAGFTEDYREGVAAFMEKRPPSYKGK